MSPSEHGAAAPPPPVPDAERALADRLAELTVALCAVPSVTGNEDAMADDVEARLRACRGVSVTRAGRCVLARTPPRGRPLVLLVGHTDTVPPKSGDPAPFVAADRVHGLGSSDMKGGLAVMLTLAEDVGADDLAYDLGWVFYDHEEGPWVNSGLGPLLEQVDWLRQAALAFCLEPSDNVVQLGCMGTIHAKVAFTGRSAHSARPWQGDNAIHKAADLLARLGALAPVDVERDGFLFREVISATQASGGTARNVIPDRFELNLNYRFAPGTSLDTACAALEAFVGPGPEVTFTERAPSGPVVGDNPLLKEFLTRNGNAVTAKQAWTDVARLGAAGIDAVNLGPGLAAQAHQAREHTDVALLVESYRQFERFLRA